MSMTVVAREFFTCLSDEYKGFSFASQRSRLALKAALSAVLAVLTALWLEVDHAYWAAFTALVVTQPNAGASIEKGALRVLGTIAGGALGVALVQITQVHYLASLTAIFACTVATIHMSQTSPRFSYAWFLGGITAVIVLMAGLSDPYNSFDMAFYRCFEIIIGIGASLFVSLALFPDEAAPVMEKNVFQCAEILDRMMDAAVDDYLSGKDSGRVQDQRAALEAKLSAYRELSAHARAERAFSSPRYFHDGWLASRIGAAKDLLAAFQAHAKGGVTTDFHLRYKKQIRDVKESFSLLLAAAPKGGPDMEGAVERFRDRVAALVRAFDLEREDKVTLSHPIADVVLFYQFMRMLTLMADLFSTRERPKSLHRPVRPWEVRYRPVFKHLAVSGLAMVAVPVLWSLFDFPGLAEVAVSVVVIMQPNDVETERKAFLRTLGCFVGGLAGLVLLGFPGMQSFPVWIVTYFAALFVLSVVNFGNGKCSYAGLQGGFALTMALVQGNHAATQLAPPVERLAGIFLAAVVILILSSLILPDSPLRKLAGEVKASRMRCMELLSALAKGPDNAGEAALRAAALSMASGLGLDDLPVVRRMSEMGRSRSRYIRRELASYKVISDEARGLARLLASRKHTEMLEEQVHVDYFFKRLAARFASGRGVDDMSMELSRHLDRMRERSISRGFSPLRVVMDRAQLYGHLAALTAAVGLASGYKAKTDESLGRHKVD